MASNNEKLSVSIERSEKKKVIVENPNEVRGSSTAPAVIVDERERSTVTTERSPKWFLPILVEVAETHQTRTKELMHKVPTFLRSIENHKGCFDPMAVSIGPYHHGKKEVAKVEKLKAEIAKDFIGEDIEKLDWFEEVARNARACYYYDDEEEGSLNKWKDDQFTRMMFLDGCFILYIISCQGDNKLNSNTKLKPYQMAFVSRDLFLLENQLPFLVLEELMKLKDKVNDWHQRIQKFVTNRTNLCSSNTTKSFVDQNDDRHAHLLDLLHKTLSGVGKDSGSQQRNNDSHTFRSVIELKAAGIRFKKSNHGGNLEDVKFELHSWYGNVFLPPLIIDDLTRSSFLNLAAYEACPDGPSDSLVTSYICFLDALIDRAEDVKELRSKGILHNLLGSDEKVAELFNELANQLVPSQSTQYSIVMNDIERFYKLKWFRWAREFCSTHFRSPWTAFALFVGAALILLTFVQTYFAVFPVKGEEERRAPRTIRYS
ncbi:UPF0481 protein At3g47200-like [Macadamia integrifolia]|uniref:UPF0481 protein At3g47200-like n=1 Tax=Macadamia integrifolia TaxID=60698 RepID=UPI001C500AD8|nr:UPF0481 protein At3g47200-like [Macadamia integrifolia]